MMIRTILGERSLLFSAAAIVPLVTLFLSIIVFWASFSEGLSGAEGGFTLRHYAEVYSDPFTYRALGNTAVFAMVTLLIAFAFGVPVAWLAERTDLPRKPLLYTLMMISVIVPTFFVAMGWILILHPRIGFVNTWLQQLTGLPGFGIDITTLAGLGFVQGLSLAPLAFIMVAAALRAVDPTLEEAGEVHGLNRFRVTLSVTLPLVLPALMAAAIYIFVIAVAAFDVPAVMGLASRIYTFSTLIYVKMLNPSGPPEYGVPAAVGTLMFFVAILLTWWYSRFLRQTERYEVVSGRGYRPKLVTLGRWRHAAWGFCWLYLFLGIGAPLLMVAWTSLMPYLQPPSISALDDITTRQFENLDWNIVLRGAWNTVQLMLIVPTVTVAVCLPLAWVIVRSGSRWRFLFEFLTFLPHAMPAVVFGVAALIASLFIIGDYVPLYGTVWIIAIVYLIERVTFGSRVMNAAMMQCHRDLEDAGLVSGMSLFGVLSRIYVPLLLPALAGTWLWVALVSFRELTVAAVLFDPANVTLPVVVWNQWTAGAMGSAAAVTIVMLAVLTPLLLIYWVIAGRRALGW